MALMDTLKRKAGPLPVWAWVAGGGVALGLAYRWYQNRQAASAAATTASTTPTDSATTAGSDSGSASSPDVSGLGGTPATSGGGTAAGGTTDTSSGSSGDATGFSTGPAPPPSGYTYDQNGNLVTTAQYQDQTVFDREMQLAAEGLTVNPSTGMIEPFAGGTSPTAQNPDLPDINTNTGSSGAPSQTIGATPPPATPAQSPQGPVLTPAQVSSLASAATALVTPTAPPVFSIPATTTAPAAHETLPHGTILWHGTVTPNLQTIATAHGLPLSALRTTISGTGQHVVSVI